MNFIPFREDVSVKKKKTKKIDRVLINLHRNSYETEKTYHEVKWIHEEIRRMKMLNMALGVYACAFSTVAVLLLIYK